MAGGRLFGYRKFASISRSLWMIGGTRRSKRNYYAETMRSESVMPRHPDISIRIHWPIKYKSKLNAHPVARSFPLNSLNTLAQWVWSTTWMIMVYVQCCQSTSVCSNDGSTPFRSNVAPQIGKLYLKTELFESEERHCFYFIRKFGNFTFLFHVIRKK